MLMQYYGVTSRLLLDYYLVRMKLIIPGTTVRSHQTQNSLLILCGDIQQQKNISQVFSSLPGMYWM